MINTFLDIWYFRKKRPNKNIQICTQNHSMSARNVVGSTCELNGQLEYRKATGREYYENNFLIGELALAKLKNYLFTWWLYSREIMYNEVIWRKKLHLCIKTKLCFRLSIHNQVFKSINIQWEIKKLGRIWATLFFGGTASPPHFIPSASYPLNAPKWTAPHSLEDHLYEVYSWFHEAYLFQRLKKLQIYHILHCTRQSFYKVPSLFFVPRPLNPIHLSDYK